MKRVRRLLAVVFVLVCVLAVYLIWLVKNQGILFEDIPYVRLDEVGIPTIEARNWKQLVERQGYVVAGERLWQMDLLRRLSAGRLSEWVGEGGVPNDLRKIREDWLGVADAAVDQLPGEERRFCENYADGVNRYIKDYEGRWSLEYSFLRVEPEPWLCRDSLLIILHMADFLTGKVQREKSRHRWLEGLTEEWGQFLFPKHHPWAAPLFGKAEKNPVKLPPLWQFLPRAPLEESELANVYKDPYYVGSNAWAATSDSTTLLAGDPHLNQSVPQVWYALRLRISKSKWVAGIALPGVPGVVIGMNPQIAWSFTNLGDDVDDGLVEQFRKGSTEYLATVNGEKKHWRRVVKKSRTLKVRGEDDRVVEVWHTHRGPVVTRPGEGEYDRESGVVRQWIALKAGMLRMPTLAINKAKDWDEFNLALDGMTVPSQGAIFAEKSGSIGFRATGTEIDRNIDGLRPQAAVLGEWKGFRNTSGRRRLLIKPSSKMRFIANANAQIWEDEYGHHWDGDDRRDRIMTLLKEAEEFSVESFHRMQLDTGSRFHKALIDWVVKFASEVDPAFFERASRWNGVAIDDPKLFTMALDAESILSHSLLNRVREKFFGDKDIPAYAHTLKRSWILKVLRSRSGALAFGVSRQELADFILKYIKKKSESSAWQLYQHRNQYKGQHPLVGRLFGFGQLFRVREYPQFGYAHLVRAEKPLYGPSVRQVWDLKNPSASRWTFPVGQSGHIRSRFYRMFQKDWLTKKTYPVLDERFSWSD